MKRKTSPFIAEKVFPSSSHSQREHGKRAVESWNFLEESGCKIGKACARRSETGKLDASFNGRLERSRRPDRPDTVGYASSRVAVANNSYKHMLCYDRLGARLLAAAASSGMATNANNSDPSWYLLFHQTYAR